MNEFIAWDNEDNKFISWEDMVFTKDKNDDFIVIMKEIDEILSEGRNFQTFNYIGLKDINNKKIYTDSSICRANYFSFNNSDWISDYCYFSFDEENLRYTVHLINERESVDYEAYYFDYIEIIDTIQENKLGLINLNLKDS